MVKINFLPIEEIKKKIALKQTLFYNVIAFLVIILVFLGIYLKNVSTIHSLDKRIAYHKKKLNELKSLKNQLKMFVEKKKIINAKFKIIKELESYRLLPSYIFYVFSKEIPDKLWITRLQDSYFSLNVVGISLDEPTIVQFINNLRKTGDFSKIELVQVNQIKIKGYKFKQFKLKLKLALNKKKAIL